MEPLFGPLLDYKTKKLRGVYPAQARNSELEPSFVLMNPDAMEINHDDFQWFDEGCDDESPAA